jgi:uncharacterized membrane protein
MGALPSLGVPGGAFSAVVLALLLIVLVVRDARALAVEARVARRRSLLALRIATAGVVWLLAVQPRWLEERVERRAGRLAVLFDASRSLQVRDGEATRAAHASKLAARWRDGPGASAAEVRTFGASSRPSTLARLGEALDAREDDTRLGAAVRAVTDDGASDVGAVVVVSDGADHEDGLRPEALARAGVRVHVVALGARTRLRDDAIASVQADATAFLRQPARVRVVVRSTGGEGGPIPVALRSAAGVLREVVVEVPADGEGAVELPFVPDALGRAAFTVSIPVAAGDDVPENNERAFLVRVVRDKLRVLLVCGRPSADERFLRAFLKRDPSIDLISFFILRSTSDLTMSSSNELALIPFPTDELFSEHLGSFDVLLFQNFDYAPYQMEAYLPGIRDYVERGGSFAMIGGELSFAGGAYAETAIADVLPVVIPPSATPATDAVDTATFRPEVSPTLARHPLVMLQPDPAQSAAELRALAPLHGVNVVRGLRGDGLPLLVHPTLRDRSGNLQPVLAVGTMGKGRSLALMTDESWRWGMATAGATGDASAYDRFWDRALRWLARDPSLEPVQLTTDRSSYGPGGRVTVDVLLRDARYEPLADRAMSLLVLRGEEQVASLAARTDGEGKARVELSAPLEPGAYRVRARVESVTLPVAEEVFLVETGGEELADPRARPEFLRALAAATGGAYYANPADAPALARFDATRTRSLGTAEHVPLATWPAVLCAALLFAGEWVARRRWGRA